MRHYVKLTIVDVKRTHAKWHPRERDGRLMAKRLGLMVTGVLGVLAKAKRQDASFNLAEAVTDLKSKAGFYVSGELTASLLSSRP